MKSKILGWLWTWPDWIHHLVFQLTDHVIVQCADDKSGKVLRYEWQDGRPLIEEVKR